MGIMEFITGEKPKGAEEKNEETQNAEGSEGKYPDTCALCGQPGTDKKWAGQFWHKKCMRKAKKVGKGML